MLQQLEVQPPIDDTPADEYTIGEVAASVGISYRALRFYEQKGLLCPARRGGQRVYSRRDRLRLDVILLAKRLGFSLTDVANLTLARNAEPRDAGDAPPTIASLGLSREQIGAQVAHLSRRRETVQRAIDELREVASRAQSPRRLSPTCSSTKI